MHIYIYSNLNCNFSVLSREETDSHTINSGHYSDILQTRLWGKKKDSRRRTYRICKVGPKKRKKKQIAHVFVVLLWWNVSSITITKIRMLQAFTILL